MNGGRAWVLPLCTALGAALVAHVGIDVLGDRLLAHDTFDDVAHGSRSWALGGVTALAVALVFAAMGAAIREAHGSVEAFRRALNSALALPPATFFVAVTLVAFVTLGSMEALDAWSAGTSVDGPSDLFGGSLALGGATLLASALLCTVVARTIVRALGRVRRGLVRALAVVFARLQSVPPQPSFAPHVRARAFTSARVAVRALRRRAPPRLAFV